MEKEDLLKHIAETGYNVGFGAKKHFSTYDIVEKLPGLIGFLSTGVGVFGLYIDDLSGKSLSAIFIILGIAGLYISFYDSKKPNMHLPPLNSSKYLTNLNIFIFRLNQLNLGN